jgi:tetratricopeptide (TPR) repeat protein
MDALAQNYLGDALQALGGQNGDVKPLRKAAEAYGAALTEWSQEATPFEWANTYKSLGDALAVLGIDGGQAERLIDAVHAYQQALRETSRELAPAAWAFTQNNLGKVLR